MDKIQDIIATLRHELENGAYPRESRFPSEYELSERFSVNKKTANKAVSLLAAEGLLERGTRGKGTKVKNTVRFPKRHFVFVSGLKHPYYNEILNGFQLAALENDSLVSVAAPDPRNLSTTLRRLENSKIDGIATGSYGPLSTTLPVICLEEKECTPSSRGFVVCDSYQGGYQLMKELLSRGHRDIVIAAQRGDDKKRVDGFQNAMKDCGIMDFADRTFCINDTTDYGALVGVRKALKRCPGLTAILATSDDVIFRTVRMLEKENIDWRGRIALGGFGNVSGISNMLPMATVDQHPFHIGGMIFEALAKVIANPGLIVREYVDTELLGLENLPLVRR